MIIQPVNLTFKVLKGTATQIIAELKRVVREGNARRVVVRNKNGKVLFQTQLTAGVAGTAFATALAPVTSGILMYLLLTSDATVLVEREDDTERDAFEVDAEIIDIS